MGGIIGVCGIVILGRSGVILAVLQILVFGLGFCFGNSRIEAL